MSPMVWYAVVLLVLVIGTVGLLRLESVSTWLRAPNRQMDAVEAHAGSCTSDTCDSTSSI
jgi:hypothetical protein